MAEYRKPNRRNVNTKSHYDTVAKQAPSRAVEFKEGQSLMMQSYMKSRRSAKPMSNFNMSVTSRIDEIISSTKDLEVEVKAEKIIQL